MCASISKKCFSPEPILRHMRPWSMLELANNYDGGRHKLESMLRKIVDWMFAGDAISISRLESTIVEHAPSEQ